jgi:hypothetical protein
VVLKKTRALAAVARPRKKKLVEDNRAQPAPTDIAARAFELFVKRGCVHGFDQEDWLVAEQELRPLS